MDLKKTDRTNFMIKIAIIILSFISPLIMFFTYGEMGSISSYWNSPLQPLFILSNALTTYVFMDLPKWKLSGILLFMLTIFSVEYYPSLHNVFAISFFVVNIYPIYKLKRWHLFALARSSIHWMHWRRTCALNTPHYLKTVTLIQRDVGWIRRL